MTSTRVPSLRRGLSATVLSLTILGLGFAPLSPLVASASADGSCSTTVAGCRYNDTTAFGTGQLSCVGDVTWINMYLRVEHCDFDVLGACVVWTFVKTIATRAPYGPGVWYIPASGYAYGTNLLNDNLYHIVIHNDWGTVCCGSLSNEHTTQQFRL